MRICENKLSNVSHVKKLIVSMSTRVKIWSSCKISGGSKNTVKMMHALFLKKTRTLTLYFIKFHLHVSFKVTCDSRTKLLTAVCVFYLKSHVVIAVALLVNLPAITCTAGKPHVWPKYVWTSGKIADSFDVNLPMPFSQ